MEEVEGGGRTGGGAEEEEEEEEEEFADNANDPARNWNEYVVDALLTGPAAAFTTTFTTGFTTQALLITLLLQV